jgi:hypothetical protein
MDEVEGLPVDGGGELIEAVQRRFLGSPVEPLPPVLT